MDSLTAMGLGLDYGDLRLGRTTQAWLDAGGDLRTRVVEGLHGSAAQVELVGSSSVPGLLAKPIIDLAVGLAVKQPISPVTARLEADGWIYRGDAGDQGGHVFVLECRPWHRVAHLHVVDRDGDQWRAYLRLREILRRSARARERYEAVKLRLAEQRPVDRKAYTDGKSAVVASIIEEAS
uniref:GrpB family protein n=1 Tax=Paractinoplanes polyasparticus TaxID=2856853 RepID=UPI001C84C8CC|nr:GrpB family protein [Actinoplanes polyasparticus]